MPYTEQTAQAEIGVMLADLTPAQIANAAQAAVADSIATEELESYLYALADPASQVALWRQMLEEMMTPAIPAGDADLPAKFKRAWEAMDASYWDASGIMRRRAVAALLGLFRACRIAFKYRSDEAGLVQVGGAIVVFPPPPPMALNTPADNATDVPVNTSLTWTAHAGAQGYDVYWWRDGTDPDPILQHCTTRTMYTPPMGLQVATVYKWKIVSLSPGGNQASAVRTFTTAAS
jgi:hypothetical protein